MGEGVSTRTRRDVKSEPEEISSSESDEEDVRGMRTEDEDELWRRVEMEGFPREDTMVAERPEGFPGEEDIESTQVVWYTPLHPRIGAAGHVIHRGSAEFRRYVSSGGGAVAWTARALQLREWSTEARTAEVEGDGGTGI